MILPFVCGAIAWSGLSIWVLPLAFVLPMTLSLAHSRWSTLAGSLFYFLGALWPVVPAAKTFFQQDSLGLSLLTWLAWSALLAVPFVLVFWIPQCMRAFAVFVVIAAEALLPIGIASPFVAAGVLFPGMGVFGLLGVSLLILGAADRGNRTYGIIIAVVVSLLVTLWINPQRRFIPGWEAHNTHLLPNGDPWAQYDRVQHLLDIHNRSGATVSIFPEDVLSRWDDGVSGTMIGNAMMVSVPADHTIILGAERYGPNSRIPIVLARGRDQSEYVVRVPVPIAEWGRDVSLNIFGPSTIRVQGVDAGVLICYEQLLVLPVLQSVYGGATALIAPSNLYWSPGSGISNIQDVSVQSWARLFNLPYYRAVNR